MLTNLRPTTDNPVPIGAISSQLVTRDGVQLRLARWRQTARKQRGTVFLMQGRSECIEKYFETIIDLRRRGFHVIAFDWRGQGGSSRLLADPRKGHVEDFSDYGLDLESVLTEAVTFAAPRPWFGIAHSMGGAALLLALQNGESRLDRAAITSPLIRLAGYGSGPVPRIAAFVCDFLGLGGSYVPGGGATSISTKRFATNLLTSDPERYQRHSAIVTEAPELALGDPTIGWVTAMYRAFDRFADPDFGRQFTVPTLIITSGGDQLCATPAALALASRIRGSGAVDIRGARHELMSEADLFRDRFFAALDAFIPGETASSRSGA